MEFKFFIMTASKDNFVIVLSYFALNVAYGSFMSGSSAVEVIPKSEYD